MTCQTKTGFFRIVIFCLFLFAPLCLPAFPKTVNTLDAGDLPPQYYYQQAHEKLVKGDSTGALQLLNQALKLDPRHGEALIWRGRLNLISGNLKQARKDFKQALIAKSPKIRSLAHVGFGHVLIRNPVLTSRAIQHYRLAMKIDPTSFEALYDLPQAGYVYEKIAGKRVGSEALTRLVCQDPLYKNAYRIWRDLVPDKSEKEIRKVDIRLEAFLADHPDSTAWWVDLASDRFYLGETSRALETLDSLLSANPQYFSPDIPLLRARCCLELVDSARFQEYYDKAVLTAGATGDFTSLFREAEPLFYPEAYDQWKNCRDNRDRTLFFHRFWAQLNPDPLADRNSRLVEHYRRIRQAEKDYHFQLPHISYNKILSLTINERILKFIRYGIQQKPTWKKRGGRRVITNPLKFWYCGDVNFLFDDLRAAEKYDLQPEVAGHLENMMKAISMQIAPDETIYHTSEFYFASFLSPESGNVEVEFYQKGAPGSGPKPRAEVAVFNTDWSELERGESLVYKVKISRDSLWLAVHRIDLPPGLYWFGVRMLTADSRKWVERGLIDSQAFDRKNLDISRIVLGSLPESNLETHTRRGVEILPRPSLSFKKGEIINVYMEIYNLQPDVNGLRSYTQRVDVTRVEDEAEKVRQFAEGTVKFKRLDKDKPSTGLQHRFDRVAETLSGPVAENFTLDTAMLSPGNYRLVIGVRDNSDGSSKLSSCIFELGK